MDCKIIHEYSYFVSFIYKYTPLDCIMNLVRLFCLFVLFFVLLFLFIKKIF